MIRKEQWVVLPYQVANQLPNLRLSPPGVVPQRDRRPRWIVDYSFSGVNQDTLPLAPSEAMQFGHTLDRLLREILLANPDLGPVYMMKVDIADGFYRINLTIDEWCCLPCCGRGDGFNYLFLAMGSANEYEPLATWCNTNWPQEESAHFN